MGAQGRELVGVYGQQRTKRRGSKVMYGGSRHVVGDKKSEKNRAFNELKVMKTSYLLPERS
jgi:hypothetical protein